MNRRHFLSGIATGVSGSFVLGAAGGLGTGAAGAAVGLTAYNRSLPAGQTSFAQQGEDLIVETICKYLKIDEPTYIDIGAAEPVRNNNTFLFYQKGARGVLVEPNPSLVPKLRSTRPGDTVLGIGIGITDQEEADYYMIGGPGGFALNTFSREMAESYATKTGNYHYIEKVIKVPLVNINKVLAEHFDGAPDFFSIDVEGLDFDILKTLDFRRYRPQVFCVETLIYGSLQVEKAIVEFMQSKDYVPRGDTFVNTIFVDRHRLGTA
jgi:FkbM family methyltransferase